MPLGLDLFMPCWSMKNPNKTIQSLENRHTMNRLGAPYEVTAFALFLAKTKTLLLQGILSSRVELSGHVILHAYSLIRKNPANAVEFEIKLRVNHAFKLNTIIHLK